MRGRRLGDWLRLPVGRRKARNVLFILLVGAVGAGGPVQLVAAGQHGLGLYVEASAAEQPGVPGPYLERSELVTDRAVTGDGGNGWGPSKLRIVRTSQGDVLTTFPAVGSDSLHRIWVAMRRTDQGWAPVDQGSSGREPVNLLRLPGDLIQLVSWNDGLPQIVTPGGGTSRVLGDWATSDWPYHGAAVNSNGDVFVVETDDSVVSNGTNAIPGTLYLGYRSIADGVWHFTSLNTDLRYTHARLIPTGTSGLTMVATSAVTWATEGYGQPPGSFGYVWDRLKYFHTDDLVNLPMYQVWVAYEPQPVGTSTYVNIELSDTYLDTQGRTHITYAIQGPSTNQDLVGHHAIVQNGAVVKDVLMDNVPCPNSVKIVQDSTGQFYLLSECGSTIYVYPSDASDGTTLGAYSALDVSQYPIGSAWWIAASQGGNLSSIDYVDGVYPSNNDTALVYFRIRLR